MKGGKQGGGGGRGGKPSGGGGKSSRGGKPSGGGKPARGGKASFGARSSRSDRESFGGSSSRDEAPEQRASSSRGVSPRPRRPAASSPGARGAAAANRGLSNATPSRSAHPESAAAGAAQGASHSASPSPSQPAVSVQRTLNVPASAVIRAINDPDRREWSPQKLYRVVSVLAPRFIRLAFPDGTLVAISVTRQGNARCAVTVELTKLPAGSDERELRDRWAYALAALEDQLDTAWD